MLATRSRPTAGRPPRDPTHDAGTVPQALPQTDPFADHGFLDRFGKLLPMLASSQGGEADAARRKLLEHMAAHRVSLPEVVTRLRGAPLPRPEAPARFPREAELTRELELVRHARVAAEQMARNALQQNAALQHRAAVAEAEVQALVGRRSGVRIIAFAATLLALGFASIVVVQNLPAGVPPPLPVVPGSRPAAATMQPSRPQAMPPRDAAPAMTSSERLGYVLSNDIAVRADAAPDSPIRGFLPRGTEVIVMRPVTSSGLDWLLVRSSLGVGFVPAAVIAGTIP